MEFKAKLVDGVLEIFPEVEHIKNKEGGTDVIVHALNPSVIMEKKVEILQKLALGEKVNIEVENGKRDL